MLESSPMIGARVVSLVLVVLLAVPPSARAASEGLAAGAASRFERLAAVSLPPLGSVFAAAAPKGLFGAELERFLREAVSVPVSEAPQLLSPVLAADLDLPSLLNRHLKTSLRYDLGGKSVWFGATFDRRQNAHLGVLIEGEVQRYYNVLGLVDRPQRLRIGTDNYRLELWPNPFGQLKSRIVVVNEDYDERRSFSITELLAAISRTGGEVSISGLSYRVFYGDGLEGGVPNPASRLFAFLHIDREGNPHIYLVSESLVPSDRIAVFPLFGGASVGLSRRGESLRIYTSS